MERYHMYKLGIAILFYAIYCGRSMIVNGLEVDDSIGALNNKTASLKDNYLNYYHGVQGKPGVDYPIFRRIPRTKFSCKEVESGYYADLETNCQVFHICNEGSKISFLCPNGTIFQQADLICDWWFKVNCTNSPNLYEESAELLRESQIRRKASRRVLNRGDVTFTSNERPTSSEQQFARRKMDIGTSGQYADSSRQYFGASKYNSEEETQMAQESASFFGSNSHRNSLHPNHRTTYSDIKDTQKFVTSSIRPLIKKNSFNNGQPFVVSTPKLGTFPTERNNFAYSPTIPTTQRNFATITTAEPITDLYTDNSGRTVVPQANFYGDKLPNKDNSQYVQISTRLNTVANNNNGNVGKQVESTTPVTKNKDFLKKTRGRNSFTLGLNSAQGSIGFGSRGFSKNQQVDNNSHKFNQQKSVTTEATHTLKPDTPNYRRGKSNNNNRIKLNLSTNQGTKLFNTKNSNYNKNNDYSRTSDYPNSSDYPKKLIISLENELPERTTTIRNGFYITKANQQEKESTDFKLGSNTGSKNTYIPTTQSSIYTNVPRTTEYISNTFGFVKPTGMHKPKPFQLPSSISPPIFQTTIRDYQKYPNYQTSSASPFTNIPPTLPTRYDFTTRKLPTIYNAARGFSTAVPDNINKMIESIKSFENQRPGLIVPPSVGPQTLHTLAVYFANALDGLAPPNITQDNVLTAEPHEHNAIINSLLTSQTVHGYNELFNYYNTKNENDGNKNNNDDKTNKNNGNNDNNNANNNNNDNFDNNNNNSKKPYNISEDDGQEDENSEDLLGGHSINAVQSPRVRQLAKVFTQALSSYLENPDMFRRVLQEIRPTEPPIFGASEIPVIEEDELLNFSDADIKPENPRLPTPVPVNPTWGYISGGENSTPHTFKHNSLENLQISDSQSFIPDYNNEVVSNRINKSLKDLNHWTTSADVTKLWQTTLFVNPESVNYNLATTNIPDLSLTSEDFDNFIDRTTEDFSSSSAEFATESIIDYELHALPKINLNSTQVHGLLIDYMNSTKNDDNNKLHRILSKLNTTEEQFLDKMKEIEQNPLTKRLILLLINECGKEKSLENKAGAIRDIISLGGSNNYQIANSNLVKKEASGFTKLVDKKLKDDDHDSRALQLLNSLYSIASRYGK